MYCKKCGKEINDGSVFCASCGTKQNEQGNGLTISDFITKGFNDTIIFRLSAICCSIIMILLSFTKWLNLEFSYVGLDNSYTTLGFVGVISKYKEMGILEGGIYTFFQFAFLIMNIGIIIAAAIYIVNDWKAPANDDKRVHIFRGYSIMELIIFILGFSIMVFFIINKVGAYPVLVSFNMPVYIILVLACINRFFILPKYDEIYYGNLKKLKEEQLQKEKNDEK